MENHRKGGMANSNEAQPHAGNKASAIVPTLDYVHVDAQIAALQKFKNRLHRETSQCEGSTAKAILAAQPLEKLSALNHGLDEWMKALRASAIWYYKISFECALRNIADLRGENPADFTYRSTETILTSFLGVSALDGEEEGSNGRVREFFRHVVYGDSVSTSILRLPGWAANRSIGARLAARATGRPFPPVGGTLSDDLSAEHTDSLIRSAEARLTASLRDALLEANRDATIDTCLSTSSPLKREQRLAEAPSQRSAGANGDRRLKYQSPLKRAICLGLIKKANSTARELCDWLDEEDAAHLPARLVKNGDRTFRSAYRDLKRRSYLESVISKVRGDMRSCGLL
jgi:hypothetical protein